MRSPSTPSVVFAVSLGLTLLGCQDKASPIAEPAPNNHAQAEPPVEAPASGDVRLRTVYVPAYSHLPKGKDAEGRSLLSILLSVRNIDPSAAITLTHVDYFDTYGHRVRRYLPKARTLRPLETVEFVVDTFDASGGSGANFLVYWEGPSDAQPLLTEAVMVGHVGAGQAVSFTSRGVELTRRPEKISAESDEDTTTPSP